MRFRYKRSIKEVNYLDQIYIWATSKRFAKLTVVEQKKIRRLCREAGGEHSDALFAFVTTDSGAVEVCDRYFISESTLERAVKKYYLAFQETL